MKRKKIFLKKIKKNNNSNKLMEQQIESPFNNNEYLINNKSSPFYDDNDNESELSLNFFNNELVNNDIDIKEIDFNIENKLDSTSDESEIINDLERDILYLPKKEEIYINNVN